MLGTDFTYGTKKLSDYQMIMAKPDDDQQFVTRAINKGEITSVRPKPNHYGVTYEDALVLNFFILKSAGCNGQQYFKMTGDDIHSIRSWLESPKKPTELTVTLQDNTLTTHYFGIFTSVQPYVVGDECYGLNLEFTCDSPYGYSDESVLTYTLNGGSSAVSGSYNNLTADKESYIRPKITIESLDKFGSNETLSITNTSDSNKVMSVILPKDLSKLIIDCEKKIVTDETGALVPMSQIGITNPITGEYSFISTDQFAFYWFSLMPGVNNFSITPSATNTIKTVKISLRYIIKSGGF